MEWVSGHELKQLRERLGMSQAQLRAHMVVSIPTICKYEREGTANRGYVECLQDLIRRRDTGDMDVSQIKRGRPDKAWHVAQPRRGYSVGRTRSPHKDYTHYHFRLFLPDHPDHLKWLVEPPTCNSVAWLRLCNYLDSRDTSATLYSLTLRHADGREEMADPMPLSHWRELGEWMITKT